MSKKLMSKAQREVLDEMYPSYDDKDLETMARRKKGVSCTTYNSECQYSKLKERLEKHNCPDWTENEDA